MEELNGRSDIDGILVQMPLPAHVDAKRVLLAVSPEKDVDGFHPCNVGNLVTWDLTDGTGGAIIGPKTGFPYPPDGHVSAMAYRQPGWIFVSTYGNTSGAGLLDLENLIADTNTGKVCRVGRHRSFGKANNVIGYWAESHTVPSPSGTRAVFASDWGGGNSVDSYVLELPGYQP